MLWWEGGEGEGSELWERRESGRGEKRGREGRTVDVLGVVSEELIDRRKDGLAIERGEERGRKGKRGKERKKDARRRRNKNENEPSPYPPTV